MDEGNIKIYWDRDKKVPFMENKLKNIKELSNDLRPVFLEEKFLLYNINKELGEDFLYKSVWVNRRGSYYIDGIHTHYSFVKKSKEIKNLNEFSEIINNFNKTPKMQEEEDKIISNFITLNSHYLNGLLKSEEKDSENYFIGAEPFINEMANKYSKRLLVVSFSGGKDSTVVSHLVRKSLNNQNILHIFGDTTLEMKNTYNYIEKFKNENEFIPFFEEKNYESNFFEICEQIGPPSRVKSWCCSIFKTGPMGTTISDLNQNILTFYGVRRIESASRGKYSKVTQSPKIEKQIVASPIIDWMDIDVWLYILSNKIDFNFAYRQGFARVGCWCCPNNSYWSDFLSSVYNNKSYTKWNSFLLDFAKKIGKKDYINYVNDGKWKARQGGAGLDTTKTTINSKECISEKNSKNYELHREVNEEFFELFKPFGILNFELGNKKLGEVFILNSKKEPIIKLLAKNGTTSIRISIINNNGDNYLFSKIENQLRKFNVCIYCKACNSTCPTGAIEVINGKYKINENNCIHCLKCISHFVNGCLIASSLVVKK